MKIVIALIFALAIMATSAFRMETETEGASEDINAFWQGAERYHQFMQCMDKGRTYGNYCVRELGNTVAHCITERAKYYAQCPFADEFTEADYNRWVNDFY